MPPWIELGRGRKLLWRGQRIDDNLVTREWRCVGTTSRLMLYQCLSLFYFYPYSSKYASMSLYFAFCNAVDAETVSYMSVIHASSPYRNDKTYDLVMCTPEFSRQSIWSFSTCPRPFTLSRSTVGHWTESKPAPTSSDGIETAGWLAKSSIQR